MSHFLIVELSEEPIAIEDRATAGYFYDDSELQHVADYVQDLNETSLSYDEAVELFNNELGAAAVYNKEDNSITFTHIEKFFEEDFRVVKELVENATLDDFMDDYWSYRVRDRISPTFGTYVYHTDECTYSLHNFLRGCKNGEKLYLGGICDYHC